MFAVILIPNFSLQAVLRAEPELLAQAVALVDPDCGAEIIQATSAAKNTGVAEGLTPAQAIARCPELKIIRRSHSQETSAMEILLQTADAFSPNIESTALGVCTLELKGLGLREKPAACRWAEKILRTLAPFHLDAKAGIAPTPELALLAAQVSTEKSRSKPLDQSNRPPSQTAGELFPLSRPESTEVRLPQNIRALDSGIAPIARQFKPSDNGSSSPGGEGRGEGELLNSRVHEALTNKFIAKENCSNENPASIHGENAVFIVQSADDFVAQLPVTALQPALQTAAVLARWGIRTVGQFLALGKNEISERLGVETLALFERVSEAAVRPLKRVAPPEHFSEQIEFENEIETAAPLIFVLRRFVEQLALRLQAIYLVVGEFQLRLGLASGAQYDHTFKIPSPTGKVETLFRMLQTHLETVRTASPIVSLQLAAQPARPDMHQFGLFENTLRNSNQFAETLARLTALAGAENIGTPVLEATHKPDAFQMRRPDFDSVPARDAEPGSRDGLPLRRFRPPLPAHFKFHGTHPALIRSRMFNGAVKGVRGPFVSSGQWWDDNRWAREEWDIETAEGALLRIFRSGDGCFIEGVYD